MYEQDWQIIERLEETDPSPDDGSWGGDYCRHGTYVGTPGGADYLCGYCEMGENRWVEDPQFGLELHLNVDPPEHLSSHAVQVWFRESDKDSAWNRILKSALNWQEVFEEHGVSRDVVEFVWQVRRYDSGYWTE